jgi:hypothetical protein
MHFFPDNSIKTWGVNQTGVIPGFATGQPFFEGETKLMFERFKLKYFVVKV